MNNQARAYDPGIYGELGKRVAAGDMTAFARCLQGASDGDGYAQLEVGFAYAKGNCVKQDNRLAAQWYEKAAAQGVLNAQFNLGCLHYLGLGCKRSVRGALHWLEIAANGGHAGAKANLVPMQMEASLVAEEHAYWLATGVNKAPGLVKYELAHGYLDELKELVSDVEVRRALAVATTTDQISLGTADQTQQALMLIYNISSATPLSIDQVASCAVNDDWGLFDDMPEADVPEA